MIGFAWLAWLEEEKSPRNIIFVLFIASAILINPLFKIALGRSIWNIIDVIWALFLLLTLKRK